MRTTPARWPLLWRPKRLTAIRAGRASVHSSWTVRSSRNWRIRFRRRGRTQGERPRTDHDYQLAFDAGHGPRPRATIKWRFRGVIMSAVHKGDKHVAASPVTPFGDNAAGLISGASPRGCHLPLHV